MSALRSLESTPLRALPKPPARPIRSRWHRRSERLSLSYRFTVFLWWYISIGATVITLGLFGVKIYEWVAWTRVPLEPQMHFVQWFCPALFVVLGALTELGWLSGTTTRSDRRLRGRTPAPRRRRNGSRPIAGR